VTQATLGQKASSREKDFTGLGPNQCWSGSRCYRYGLDRELLVKERWNLSTAGVGERRGIAKVGWNLGHF
jgi:hypothetical protein